MEEQDEHVYILLQQLWWLQNTAHGRWPYTELCSYDNDLAYDLDVSPFRGTQTLVKYFFLHTEPSRRLAVRLGLGVPQLTYLLVLPTNVLLIH